MQEKKEILNVFFKIGIMQILPAILAIFMIIGIAILMYLLINFPPNNGEAIRLSIATSIYLLFLFGLISSAASSFYFIRANQTNNYEKLAIGMKYLNWGWLILSLFLAIMFSIFFLLLIDI